MNEPIIFYDFAYRWTHTTPLHNPKGKFQIFKTFGKEMSWKMKGGFQNYYYVINPYCKKYKGNDSCRRYKLLHEEHCSLWQETHEYGIKDLEKAKRALKRLRKHNEKGFEFLDGYSKLTAIMKIDFKIVKVTFFKTQREFIDVGM